MLDIQDVFINLLELVLLIGVGYGAVRFQVLPASASKHLSSLLMNITLPATLFTSLVQPYDPAFLHSTVLIIVLGSLFYILCALVSALCARIFRVPKSRQGVWMFSCIFSNNGFMGFPLCLALFGEEGLVLAVFLGIPFNLMVYTFGVKLVCMDRSAASDAPPVSLRSILLTAVNIATLLGLLFYVLQLPIPEVLDAPLTYLSDVTTPLSMFIIGMNLTGGKMSAIFRDRDVFSSSFVRLLLLPLLVWGILQLIPMDEPLVVGVLVIIMAMPTAAICSLLAETYEVNTQFSAELVFLSSLLCLVTIPLISLLL